MSIMPPLKTLFSNSFLIVVMGAALVIFGVLSSYQVLVDRSIKYQTCAEAKHLVKSSSFVDEMYIVAFRLRDTMEAHRSLAIRVLANRAAPSQLKRDGYKDSAVVFYGKYVDSIKMVLTNHIKDSLSMDTLLKFSECSNR